MRMIELQSTKRDKRSGSCLCEHLF